jgi:NADH:ubiquinone oxidoreductase subunit 6 (subunit J)
MTETTLCYILSSVAVWAGLAILLGRNLVLMSCWLIGMLLAVAGLVLKAGEWIPALAQAILLVGGLGTLFLVTAIRLARMKERRTPKWGASLVWLLPLVLLMLAGMHRLVQTLRFDWAIWELNSSDSLAEIGNSFLNLFLGPFLLTPVLVLVVLLAAVYLLRRPDAAGQIETPTEGDYEGKNI